MRILLTGATGQVGGALYRALPPMVVAVNRQELDLSHPEQIYVALDRIAPDLIVNPAAYTAVDRAEDEREAAFRINAEFSRRHCRMGSRGQGTTGSLLDRLCI